MVYVWNEWFVYVCDRDTGDILQDYIVIFCMYVFRGFHLTLGGAVLFALISNPRGFFFICGNIPRCPTCVLAANLCVMCLVLRLKFVPVFI